MATQSATFPATASVSAGVLLPAFTLWWREVVRFYRQRARVVGVRIISPLLFWIVLGSGFGTSFRSGQAAGQQHYLDYFYPGTLVMIVLFTAIFTMMSGPLKTATKVFCSQCWWRRCRAPPSFWEKFWAARRLPPPRD